MEKKEGYYFTQKEVIKFIIIIGTVLSIGWSVWQKLDDIYDEVHYMHQAFKEAARPKAKE